MKQSTKLLSLVLALVMAFSCMSVIGNAELVKTEVTWDNIDDANLSAEQVADLALDLVDNDLLAGMDTIDLSIVGELRLNKIDYIFEDICSLRDNLLWGIAAGLLGSIGDLDFKPLLKSGDFGLLSSHTAYQRGDGDLKVVGALLDFIGCNTNATLLSAAANGIGTDDGVDLGLIGSFLDLGDIGDMLADIPSMLVGLVYDLLIFGSYGYSDNLEDLKAKGQGLPEEVNTLDEIVNNALLNLLINPQDYEYEGEGDAAVKEWDEYSYLSKTLRQRVEDEGRDAIISEITPLENSLFTILDNVAQTAIDDFAINALNNNLKKALMEAVEADLNLIDKESLPADVKAAFELDKEEYLRSYVNYISYDCLAKSGNTWYYTTLQTEVVEDTTGEPVLDEDGNEVTERIRKFYKVNMSAANDFAKLINWDWKFVRSDVEAGEGETQIIYSDLIDTHGSIFASLNAIIGMVYDTALLDTTKADFVAQTGKGWIVSTENDMETNLNDNINRLVKYLLVNFGDKIFGTSSPYAKLTWENLATYGVNDVVDLAALIGPEFFKDVMPQIIIPKNANGTYAFHDGEQLLEFGALVIREFITDIAPNINYDAYIFEAGNVASANDRLFKAANTADDWVNIILNMGVDIGATYLNQLTNFSDFCKELSGDANFDLEGLLTAGGGKEAAHWQAILDYAILWAVKYVSPEKSSGVLSGISFNEVKGINGPLNKLSYILNSLLPLGFVNGCTSDAYDLDANLLLNRLIDLFKNFNLNAIFGLFGRNTDSTENILNDKPLVQAVLELVNGILNLVFRKDILQETDACSIDAVISKASLKTTIYNLLTGLNASKDAILLNALPTVGKLIKGWGTEQSFNNPDISLSPVVDLSDGDTLNSDNKQEPIEVLVRNASNGVWRHYRDADGKEYTDNQYKIQVTKVAVSSYKVNGESANYATISTDAGKKEIDYGAFDKFSYTVAGVPAEGGLARFDVSYIVIGEDGSKMADGKPFTTRTYVWFNHNPSDQGTNEYNDSKLLHTSIYTPQYVGLSNALDTIPELGTSYFGRDYELWTQDQTAKITNKSGTVDGLTFASLEQKFANSKGGRYAYGIQNFKNYTLTYTNEDGDNTSDKYTVKGSVDAAAWKAANKQPGSQTAFSIDLTDKDATENKTFKIIYYDDVYMNKLSALAGEELSAPRLAEDYNTTGYSYADKVLVAENEGTEKWNSDDFVLKETAFTDTVWVVKENGKYREVSEDTEGAYEVTKINNATAWANYTAAFYRGAQGGKIAMRADNINCWKDSFERYNALRVAVNDVEYLRKTAEQKKADALQSGQPVEDVGGDIDALKTALATAEARTMDKYNYTDYKMYRLNRFNDARNDAAYYINLKNDASNATVDEIDETFPYTWINEDDLRTLVKGDKYEANILALLEKMDDEEKAQTAEWLAAKKREYQGVSILDVEMATSYLALTEARLLKRDHGIKVQYLADEITSANKMVGAASQYTADSWKNYQAALTEANKYVTISGNTATKTNDATQKLVFQAKYNLMVARNALVKTADAADYTEINALIAQAKHALENQGLYNNTAKDFGMVLAELGYEDFTNADGDKVQLFPGSALLVVAEAYGKEDQDKIDDAATALKEALARLKFKGTTVSGATVTEETLVEADEENGIEAVLADVARIAANQDATAVKNLFTVTADGNVTVGIENITVSNDVHYTIETDLKGFAGTNSTVTFYTVNNGVKIPVKTIKLVVDGDVNGDGAVDVLDLHYAALVEAGKGDLEGCYLLAGDIDGTYDRKLTEADYSSIVNKALA